MHCDMKAYSSASKFAPRPALGASAADHRMMRCSATQTFFIIASEMPVAVGANTTIVQNTRTGTVEHHAHCQWKIASIFAN